MKICLVSISASHYRRLIYKLIDNQLGCDFIFGKDVNKIKTFDISELRKACEIKGNKYLKGRLYRLPGLIRKTRGYDVIIDDTGILCISSWLLAVVALFRRQKIFLWGHGWYGRESIIKKWIKRVYSALTSGMFVYGNYATELMKENGFNAKKLHVIHNSLDYDTQLDLRKKMYRTDVYASHFGNNQPVLIMLGRLNFRKHLGMLITAMWQMRQNGDIYNLVLVGEGEEKEKVQRMVEEKGLSDQVWFYGPCYDEETNAELLYNADVCIVPGDIGLTAIHAMSFGCPCISHDYYPNQGPEFEAITSGITGDFYHYNNIVSLCETIRKWFEDHGEERDRVRVSCYKEVDINWNPHKQIEIIKSVVLNG